MGLVPKPEISLYWSKNILYIDAFITKLMTRVRFELLIKFMHFNNNAGALQQEDKLYKLRPLVDMLNKQYHDVYKPGAELIIDESMVPFRGRVGFRKYLPGKSHKYVLKSYKLCTPSAYTLQFEVHTGTRFQFQGLNTTESLTVHWTEKYLNNGCTLFADNYYCSVVLAEFLLKKQTYLCGTIGAHRKYLSKAVTQAKLKKNEMKCQENEKGVKFFNWKDKRNVLTIYTVPEHSDVLVPSCKKARNREIILKPESVLSYNQAKKGVYVSDQLTSYYSPMRKTKKWYRKLAIELITGTSVINASVLYNKYYAKNPTKLRHFRESLVFSLTKQQSEKLKPGRACSTISGKRTHHSLSEKNGQKQKTRKRCRGCYEKISLKEGFKIARNLSRRVSTFCAQCDGNPHLCIPCFTEQNDDV